MSEIEKRVIKGFNVNKATEDQLNDLSRYELVDIILFFRNELHRYKQAIEEIKDIAENNIDDKQIMAVQTMLNGSPDTKNKILKTIIQKCEEVNDKKI